MGITGEIVRSAFSKNRSVHGGEASRNGVEKRKWSSSVRSYLCGDESNSAVAVEGDDPADQVDLVSFRSNRATNSGNSTIGRVADIITSLYAEEDNDTASLTTSSEATVNQPCGGDLKHIETPKEKHNSTYELFQQDDAALIIQSAFRSFRVMDRRAQHGSKAQDYKNEPTATSTSRESIGTSIEVQTGNSSDIFSTKEDSFHVPHTIQQRPRAQVLKIQEDWDDSTVSSVISKMRMRKRLEAATRRERALAYAFSQQLRICSNNKKQIMETNTSWSWLERWMAAREPEITTLVRKKIVVDASSLMEEKESCGSNEVCSEVEVTTSSTRNVPRPPKTTTNFTKTRFSSRNLASAQGNQMTRKPPIWKTNKRRAGNYKRENKNVTTQVSVEKQGIEQ